MGVWRPLIFNVSAIVCAVSLVTLGRTRASDVNNDGEVVPNEHFRFKRQEPDMEQDEEPEDFVADYAGNDNDETPKNTFTDTQTFNDNGINEDRFGDNFDNPPAPSRGTESGSVASEERKPKKKKEKKQHPYLKKTFAFFKRVLDPDKLMQNAYIMEMMRRFSEHKEEPEYDEQSSEEAVVHTPKPMRKRRGRPRKKDKIPPGITGILKKGMMTLSQIELDRKKLRRRVKLIKRMARKAKKPLKTAVKIFLSSRNNQGGYGGGGGGYGNTNY